MDVLADHVTSLNTHRETQTQLVKKLEEREKALQNAVVREQWDFLLLDTRPGEVFLVQQQFCALTQFAFSWGVSKSLTETHFTGIHDSPNASNFLVLEL